MSSAGVSRDVARSIRAGVLLAALLAIQTAAAQRFPIIRPVPASANPPATSATSRPAEPQVSVAPPARGDAVAWLQARVEDGRFDETPLEQVLAWVEKKTGAMVVVRWQSLEDVGIRRDMPITVDGRGRKLWRILWAISQQTRDVADDALAYEAAGDAYLFAPHGELSREMVTKIYRVTGLLQEDADFKPDYREGQAVGTGPGAEKKMHTRVKRATAPPPVSQSDGPHVQTPAPVIEISHPHEDLMDLLELILNTVEPDSWEFNGRGGRGTIFPYKRDKLSIRNSLYVHQLIGGYLNDPDALNEARSAIRDKAKK